MPIKISHIKKSLLPKKFEGLKNCFSKNARNIEGFVIAKVNGIYFSGVALLQNVPKKNGAHGFGNFPCVLKLSLKSLIIFCILSSSAHAKILIQCPDWEVFVQREQIFGLRDTPPKDNFEKLIKNAATSLDTHLKTESLNKPQSLDTFFSQDIQPAISSKNKTAGFAACTYKIKSGDTLIKISKSQLGSSEKYKELAEINNININSILKVGQVLKLPCKNPQSQGKDINKTIKIIKPLPKWKAKSGSYFTDVVKNWAKKAKYEVIKEGNDNWKLSVDVSVEGTLEEALEQLIRGFEGTGRPPSVSMYSNNVLKVGTP